MNRKSLIFYLVTAIWLIGVIGCVSEEVKPVPGTPNTVDPFKEGKIPLDMPVVTRAVNDDNLENRIDNARLIVIKNGVVSNNKMFTISTNANPNDSVHIQDYVPAGTLDIFIVANEKSEWLLGSAFPVGSLHFPTEIEQKILNFPLGGYASVSSTNPIPMYKRFKNILAQPYANFSIAGTPVSLETVAIDRLYAKVTLVIGCTFSQLLNGGDPIQLDSISVKSMPKYSFLGEGLQYQGSTSSAYNNGTRIQHSLTSYEVDATHFKDTVTYYIPEHNVQNPAYSTYLSVKVSLLGNTDVNLQREYKIVIGDGITTASNDSLLTGMLPLWNLFVTRNTHYKFDANIKSFNESSNKDIEIYPVVVSWDDSTTVISPFEPRDYQLFISQSEFHPTTTQYDGVVTIETDYRYGWKAYTEAPTGGATCTLNGATVTSEASAVSLPSGELKFRYIGGSSSSICIVVTTGSGSEKITKKIKISRP
jgi:hypothetical protein